MPEYKGESRLGCSKHIPPLNLSSLTHFPMSSSNQTYEDSIDLGGNKRLSVYRCTDDGISAFERDLALAYRVPSLANNTLQQWKKAGMNTVSPDDMLFLLSDTATPVVPVAGRISLEQNGQRSNGSLVTISAGHLASGMRKFDPEYVTLHLDVFTNRGLHFDMFAKDPESRKFFNRLTKYIAGTEKFKKSHYTAVDKICGLLGESYLSMLDPSQNPHASGQEPLLETREEKIVDQSSKPPTPSMTFTADGDTILSIFNLDKGMFSIAPPPYGHRMNHDVSGEELWRKSDSASHFVCAYDGGNTSKPDVLFSLFPAQGNYTTLRATFANQAGGHAHIDKAVYTSATQPEKQVYTDTANAIASTLHQVDLSQLTPGTCTKVDDWKKSDIDGFAEGLMDSYKTSADRISQISR